MLQSFNRGGFSNGHLDKTSNRNLIYKEKSSNEGIYLGKIFKFNSNKGHISLELENSISIGDKIRINDDLYTISELMVDNKNFKTLGKGSKVTIGRMKGDIKPNMKIYKMESAELTARVSPTFSSDKEFKKVPLKCELQVLKSAPIKLTITGLDGFYEDLSYSITSNIIPEKAINAPVTKEKLFNMLNKTGNTEFEFTEINIKLDDGLFIPKISVFNEMRRTALASLEEAMLKKYTYTLQAKELQNSFEGKEKNDKKISLLLNIINLDFDYLSLENIDNLYVPLKYFVSSKYKEKVKELCQKFKTYIYMPQILRDSIFEKDIENIINDIVLKFNIKGAVISQISQVELFEKYKLELIANYNLNIFNSYSANELKKYNISRFIPSVELNKSEVIDILNHTLLDTEIIAYGKTPLMTNNYCYLGESNKCYKECNRKCMLNEKYYLKDRLNIEFRIVPDNTCTITTIFNSKTTSIVTNDLNIDYARIDILDETIEEIKCIIDTVKNGKRFEGTEFTNGKMK